MTPSEYEIVVATRNRADALRVSLPLMAAQTRPPSRVIVVDSSDDATDVVAAVKAAQTSARMPIELIRGPRGSSVQRNVGIDMLVAPVVLFPDDDSILRPNTAEEILDVYDRDPDCRIGAVCAAETHQWPSDAAGGGDGVAYRMAHRDRLRMMIARPRVKLEHALFPDPFVLLGRSFWGGWRMPAWFPERDVVPVEWMTGFRMSFRTEAIRSCRFDERLRNYGLFEDVDASVAVAKRWMVVGARRAQIYHHRDPRRRGSGRMLGAVQILNRAYIVAKHTQLNDLPRRRLWRYCAFKVLQYRLGRRPGFAFERWEGAAEALRSVKAFAAADPAVVGDMYDRVIAEFLTPPEGRPNGGPAPHAERGLPDA